MEKKFYDRSNSLNFYIFNPLSVVYAIISLLNNLITFFEAGERYVL